jgi:hypothetical protein
MSLHSRGGFRQNPFYKFLTKEQREHARLCEWLAWVKPGLWCHYPAEGRKTPFERYLWSIMGGKKSIPDFMFFTSKKGFNGLALEFKDTGTVVYKLDGTPRKDMIDQWKMLREFEKNGWKADFAVGFDEAQEMIKNYFDI